ENIEIIVVNDGSADPMTAINLDSISDSRLNVIHTQNRGFVSAISTAIRASKSEFIAIMGAGDISFPERIALQAEFLKKHAEYGVVSCGTSRKVFGGPRDGCVVPAKKTINSTPVQRDFLEGENPFSHGEVMFRRTLYDMVGGYRTFFRFAQDRDLWIRMGQHCKFKILDQTLYERRVFYEDGVSGDKRKIALQKALSVFARQCHYDRMRMGVDYIDLYQDQAGIFREKSAGLADYYLRQAVKCWAIDDLDGYEYFIVLSGSEKQSLKLVMAKFAICISFKCSPVRFLMMKILRNRKSYESWSEKK
ncbi:MAG: glycosyltransferase, partial [Planctomycetes bacterium]|nr:glycosyltransferase [Planctomycetota bacterium]